MTIDELVQACRAWGIENSRFDLAVARRLGISAADLLALDQLEFHGGLTPGQLAERLQLTSGSVTALADRLERQGLLERRPHPSDRRSSLLCLAPAAEGYATELYEPFADAMRALAERLSDETRAEMIAFFRDAADVAARQAEVTRAAARARPAS